MNTFKHRGALGDIIYALPTIHALDGGILYITKIHQYEFLKRLLDLQENIEIKGGKVKGIIYDMNQYRVIDKEAEKNKEVKHLAVCHAEVFNVKCNLIDSWIKVSPKYKADIVVSRSTRYHDVEGIDWEMLNGYNVLFLGFENDYKEFIKKSKFYPDYIKCKDALEMAQIIAGSKLFIANQTLSFALAEAMKHPRVLEVCYRKNNCQPYGSNGYTYLTKELIERYLNDK